MDYNKPYTKIWKELDPSNDEHARIWLAELIENHRETNRQWVRGNFIFLALVGVYTLLAWSSTSEISFFSLKITDTSLLQVALPVVLAFVAYQNYCKFFFSQCLKECLEAYLREHLASVYNNDLEALVDPPSFFNVERFVSNTDLPGSTIATGFGMSMAIAFLFLPATISLCFALYNLLLESPYLLDVVAVALTCILVARSAAIIFTIFQHDKATSTD